MMSVSVRWRELVFPISVFSKWWHGTTVYSKLASMVADKWDQPYSHCMFWLRCRLCFFLLRLAIMCIRGHRSVAHRPIPSNIDLAYSEGRLTSVVLD